MGSPLTIGLMGGIASGKSAVAALLEEQGAARFDADRAAHQALADPAVLASLRQQWGDAVFADDGQLDRQAIAERIFGAAEYHQANRLFLESLIHPRVRAILEAEIAECRSAGAAALVLDVPLLLETGWADDCDLLIFVDAPDEDRRRRAAKRGWSDEDFAWREAAQAPMNAKRTAASAIVANDGSLEALRQSVSQLWAREIAPRLGPIADA